jgi:hypothetical protein
VEVIQSELKTVEGACMYRQFVSGPGGASCTRMLKRELRKQWEDRNQFFNSFRYVWGFDKDETGRIAGIVDAMPEHEHVFPLVDRGISKEEAHAILKESGIRRPVMYDLGYPNNNCVGCVKGGLATGTRSVGTFRLSSPSGRRWNGSLAAVASTGPT